MQDRSYLMSSHPINSHCRYLRDRDVKPFVLRVNQKYHYILMYCFTRKHLGLHVKRNILRVKPRVLRVKPFLLRVKRCHI